MTIDELATWLDAYGQAWEGRDADAAAVLFTEDATYHWGPFEEPLRGREAIRERWASAVADQDEISFGHKPLAIGDDDRGLAHWWVAFNVPEAGQRVRLEGIFQVALESDGTCSEFLEWFNAEQAPLTSSPVATER